MAFVGFLVEKQKKRIFLTFLITCAFGFTCYLICVSYAMSEFSPIATITFREVMYDLQQRHEHLKKTCSRLNINSSSLAKKRFYSTWSNKLLFCKVPKCASSYWMRFFQVLNNTHPKKDPFNKSRYHIHRTRMNSMKTRKTDFVNSEIKFLVTRSPYSRLYSAYIDKIFLPELWSSVGREIVQRIRHDKRPRWRICGNDVTFSEFLQLVAYRGNVSKKWNNGHWSPIERLCNPCKLKYNFIIKQETFSRDRDYLISKLGIKEQFILNYNNMTHKQFVLNSINDLCRTINIHFQNGKRSSCYKTPILLYRLFDSFQIQGYIRADATFDLRRFGNLKKLTVRKITEVFQDIYREFPVLTQDDWQKQRRSFMTKAYKLVDTEVLERIQEFYFFDFQIFNYDMEPDEIFGYRKTKY